MSFWPEFKPPPINLYNAPRLEVTSPCVSKCKLIDDQCEECKRTLEEIKNWGKFTVGQKIDVLIDLKLR